MQTMQALDVTLTRVEEFLLYNYKEGEKLELREYLADAKDRYKDLKLQFDKIMKDMNLMELDKITNEASKFREDFMSHPSYLDHLISRESIETGYQIIGVCDNTQIQEQLTMAQFEARARVMKKELQDTHQQNMIAVEEEKKELQNKVTILERDNGYLKNQNTGLQSKVDGFEQLAKQPDPIIHLTHAQMNLIHQVATGAAGNYAATTDLILTLNNANQLTLLRMLSHYKLPNLRNIYLSHIPENDKDVIRFLKNCCPDQYQQMHWNDSYTTLVTIEPYVEYLIQWGQN